MTRDLPESLRNAWSDARDDWILSDYGKYCASRKVKGWSLRKRLEAAFLAGWVAREVLKP
jgi:hypothetical protein